MTIRWFIEIIKTVKIEILRFDFDIIMIIAIISRSQTKIFTDNFSSTNRLLFIPLSLSLPLPLPPTFEFVIFNFEFIFPTQPMLSVYGQWIIHEGKDVTCTQTIDGAMVMMKWNIYDVVSGKFLELFVDIDILDV